MKGEISGAYSPKFEADGQSKKKKEKKDSYKI